MTDAEALARLLAWIERGNGMRMAMLGSDVPGETKVRLEVIHLYARNEIQIGYGTGFAEAAEDALARAPE
jgi:hypothetical protein